jgi:hypothetical protein
VEPLPALSRGQVDLRFNDADRPRLYSFPMQSQRPRLNAPPAGPDPAIPMPGAMLCRRDLFQPEAQRALPRQQPLPGVRPLRQEEEAVAQ